MKKIILISILSALCVIVCAGLISDKLKVEDDRIKAHVGETVIIKNDTLVIMDYSTLFGCYWLSDGTHISFDFVNNKSTKK